MTYLPKPYKIEEILKYNSDTWLFRVKSKMNPMPGKFIEVSIPGVGEAPLASCSYDPNYLDILTKKVGRLTGEMFKLKKGDELWIRGAYGNGFPISELKGMNLILVGGGTGMASVTSLVDYISKNRKDFGEISIYFGFRDEESVLLKEKIKKWSKEFNVHVGLSRDPHTHKYEKGHVQDIMKKNKLPVEHTYAVLCGPESLMESVTQELRLLGIKDERIYWSMERRMECAIGSCGRCQIFDLYVCRDGPVYRYDVIKPALDKENSANKEGDG